MGQKNKRITGFMILLKLSGADNAKKFITEGAKEIKLNLKDCLHRYLIALLARRYGSINVESRLKEVFGIKIKEDDKKEIEEISKTAISRINNVYNDPLNAPKFLRTNARKSLFKQLVKTKLKSKGYKVYAETMKRVGNKTIIVKVNKDKERGKIKAIVNNGIITFENV